MPPTNPKISVIMSVYNGAEYLQEAIGSIINQTYSNFEFIIIDDCSTDNSLEIIQHNAAQDERIVLVQNPENLGLIKSLNKAIKLANGELIARQDADDISSLERFEKEVAVLQQQPDCALVSCNLQIIQKNDKTAASITTLDCDPLLVSWYLLFYNHIGGHSQVMYRRDVVLSLGGYSESHLYMEDFELWCRIARTGLHLVILPEPLLTYRKHEQSVSAQKQQQQALNCYKQAQANLQDLLDQPVPMNTVKDLIGFWKGKRTDIFGLSHRLFPSGSKAKLVHETLVRVRDSFLHKYQGQQSATQVAKEIDAAIAQQFSYWLRSPLTRNHSIISKLIISRYLLYWSPLGLPTAWLIWLFRLPIDLSFSILRRTSLFTHLQHIFS